MGETYYIDITGSNFTRFKYSTRIPNKLIDIANKIFIKSYWSTVDTTHFTLHTNELIKTRCLRKLIND